MKKRYWNFVKALPGLWRSLSWRLRVAALLGSGALIIPSLIYFGREPLLVSKELSRAVYDSQGRILRIELSPDDKFRLRAPLKQISPLVIRAFLLQEDQYFFWHPGVNPLSVLRAVYHTYLRRDRTIGGSTISMQLARLKWRLHTRNPAGKSLQILRSLQLELLYTKNEILEAYLNLIPLGRNVEGIRSAALLYFDKEPKHLTLDEALALAVIPKSPARRTPGDRENRALLAARSRLFRRWSARYPERIKSNAGRIDAGFHLPFHAPHLSDYMLSKSTVETEIHTTLNIELQRVVRRQIAAYVESRRSEGINNAAALLLDYRTMEAKAIVGSADYARDLIQGQVDGTRAKRSPGSTLKPFIYALAFDQGLLHPRSMLKDAPMSFGAFTPQNYDRGFSGPIQVTEALNRSRNIPALETATHLKDPDLYDFLQQAEISDLRERDYYRLALVLGGAEVTMVELSQLYAMLANGGNFRRLKYRQQEAGPPPRQLLGPEAALLVMKILEKNRRPGGPYQEWASSRGPVHWKTGTSHGYRDGWSVGIFDSYVLAVWIGDFAGRGNPAFTGRRGASPLMFRIIDAIRSRNDHVRLATPNFSSDKVKEVRVCAVSGKLPNPHCKLLRKTLFIPGKSPISICDIHREVLIDARTGLRACGATGEIRVGVYEFWPSDLLALFRQAGIPRQLPPPFGPNCPLNETEGIAPRITSPGKGITYTVRLHGGDPDGIALRAITDGDVRELFWFVDNEYAGRSQPAIPIFWKSRPGDFVIRVVDDHGRTATRNLKVELVE